ncbi:MAG: glycosyltransferase family 2 protein [Candidatus Latescibacterota bacterium]
MSTPACAPALSICIVNWNTCALLHDCLASLFADADSARWEVLVADNASSDGSAEMVRATFPQVHLIACHQNLGFAGGNNLALAQALGRFLLLLNSDTRVQPGGLGRMLAYMEAHPAVGAAGPMLLNEDGTVQLSCGRTPGLGLAALDKLLLHKVFPLFRLGRWNHAQIRDVGWVTGACLLVRRQVVEEVGLLDSRMFMCYEDLEWCMRIRQAGWKVAYYPFSRVVHLRGQSTRQNLAGMLVVSQQSLFYLFQKHIGSGRLHALRALTVTETVLRSGAWALPALLGRRRRREARQRLRAYATILWRTLTDRSYWSPRDHAPGTAHGDTRT